MQTTLVLFPIAIAFIWGFVGWQKGSVFEMRGLLVTVISVLASLSLWDQLASQLGSRLPLAPGISAALLFVVLTVVSRVFVSIALSSKAKQYPPAADNIPDKAIGVVVGFVSGALLGSTLALLVAVGTAGTAEGSAIADSSNSMAQRIEQLPIALFRFVEQQIPEISSTRLPSVQKNPDNQNQTELVWR